MMKCPRCLKDVYDDAKFCPHCGQPLNSQCPRCGYTVSKTDRFCANCGQELTEQKIEDKIGGYYVPIDKQEDNIRYEEPKVDTYQYDEIKVEDYVVEKKEKVKWIPIIIALAVVLLLTGVSFAYL